MNLNSLGCRYGWKERCHSREEWKRMEEKDGGDTY